MFTKKKKKAKKKMKKKKPAFGGYKIKPDENMAKIIGNKPVSPSEMTKKIWAYIKKKRLAKK
jgi:upstream activation factor subunit UAF30